jgi:hypothetical protein
MTTATPFLAAAAGAKPPMAARDAALGSLDGWNIAR